MLNSRVIVTRMLLVRTLNNDEKSSTDFTDATDKCFSIQKRKAPKSGRSQEKEEADKESVLSAKSVEIFCSSSNFEIPIKKPWKGVLTMNITMIYPVLAGLVIGIAASFTGLGGGFLMVPLLLFMGYSAQKAVGTSFMAIVLISLSAIIAHNKLANVDFKLGLLLGLGGIIGAQIGPKLLVYISTGHFKRIFAFILIALAVYLFKK